MSLFADTTSPRVLTWHLEAKADMTLQLVMTIQLLLLSITLYIPQIVLISGLSL
ncbi:hypothetical protein [Niastella caeni]|uniref:hypothetical protein n=1 Tax=Niastella caeni TaxID=2569763 RepID=UPI00129B1526|nr:hypothetical protein [Niastella caeni]